MKYILIDHTADFGIHIFGSDLKELFTNAAIAASDCITDIQQLKGSELLEIHVTGDDLPDLMVNWLREILFIWAGKDLLVKDADIISFSEYELSAEIKADPFDSDIHIIKNEIKAVTYHEIQVYEGEHGWEARVLFDI